MSDGSGASDRDGLGDTIETERIGSVCVATLTDSQILGHHRIRNVGYALARLIDDTVTALVLDFSRVDFMTAAMRGKLVLTRKRCLDHGVDLHLCSLAPDIYEVFVITRLTEIFVVDQDRTESLSRLLTPVGFPFPSSDADWDVCADWWEEQGDQSIAQACRKEASRCRAS